MSEKPLLDDPDMTLRQVVGTENVSVTDDPRVWELHKSRKISWKDYEAGRQRLLSQLIHTGRRFCLSYSENPLDCEVPGRWQEASSGIWIVPTDVDVAALYAWLHLGTWLLYPHDQVIPPLCDAQYDLRRSSELARFMNEHGLEWVINAWYDNEPWHVAVARS